MLFYTVEPLLKNPPRKGQCICTKDILEILKFPSVLEIIHLRPPKRGQPLNKGQNSLILYSVNKTVYFTPSTWLISSQSK